MSRHLAAVARTANEHVGGHLSLGHTKKGEREIAGKRVNSGKITAVVQQQVVKYVQSHPVKCHSWSRQGNTGRSQNQSLPRNIKFMELSKHRTSWTSITDYAMLEKFIVMLRELLNYRI